MLTIKELNEAVDEYVNPQNLGLTILNSLTATLYKQAPSEYNQIAQRIYNVACSRDHALSTGILCTWLYCSDYKDASALKCLIHHMYYASSNPMMGGLHICNAHSTSKVKSEILKLWCNKDTHTENIDNIFSALINHLIENPPASNNILEKSDALDLIFNVLSTNKQALRKRSIKSSFNRLLNSILNVPTIQDIPDINVVKLLSLSSHINKNTRDTIATRYPKGTFDSILSTAQALGVIENPDYWVQSLFSSLNNSIHETDLLPEM